MNRELNGKIEGIVNNIDPVDLPDFFMALWDNLVTKQKEYGNGGGVFTGGNRPANSRAYILAKAAVGCGRLATELHETVFTTEHEIPGQFAETPKRRLQG